MQQKTAQQQPPPAPEKHGWLWNLAHRLGLVHTKEEQQARAQRASFMDIWRLYWQTDDPDLKHALLAQMLGIKTVTIPGAPAQNSLGAPGAVPIPTNLLKLLDLLNTIGSAEGWVWKGSGQPGSSQGGWHKQQTDEYIHPDLRHAAPQGPHYDYRDAQGKLWRVDPATGTMTPK